MSPLHPSGHLRDRWGLQMCRFGCLYCSSSFLQMSSAGRLGAVDWVLSLRLFRLQRQTVWPRCRNKTFHYCRQMSESEFIFHSRS